MKAGRGTSRHGHAASAAGDLFGSVAVIVAAAVIIVTGWTQIDPIASLVVAGIILPRTWNLPGDVALGSAQATRSAGIAARRLAQCRASRSSGSVSCVS